MQSIHLILKTSILVYKIIAEVLYLIFLNTHCVLFGILNLSDQTNHINIDPELSITIILLVLFTEINQCLNNTIRSTMNHVIILNN